MGLFTRVAKIGTKGKEATFWFYILLLFKTLTSRCPGFLLLLFTYFVFLF